LVAESSSINSRGGTTAKNQIAWLLDRAPLLVARHESRLASFTGKVGHGDA
jgi:hypothetical protein